MDASRKRLFAAAVLTALAGVAAGSPAAGEPRQAPPRLRDTGLYLAGSLTVRPEILPFSPQYPLWSDGAHKRRWIRLPAGKAIDARRPDAWEFPAGTQLWKQFSFEGRTVETRYLQRRRDGSWLYATYVWNADGTDAVLAPDGGVARSYQIAPGVSHSIPGQTDCRACHEGAPTPVLGFSALQLSPDRDPLAPHAERAEPGGLDLATLVERGLVRRLPARQAPPRIAASSPTARAALGYLHANCGNCHNGAGPLAGLGLELAHRLDEASAETSPAMRTTVGQPTLAPIPGAATGEVVRVAPGRPDRSAIVLRARSRHAVLQMPPLGTRCVDREAVDLLERWIASMPSQPKENAQ